MRECIRGKKWIKTGVRAGKFCITPNNGCVVDDNHSQLVSFDEMWTPRYWTTIHTPVFALDCQSNGNIVVLTEDRCVMYSQILQFIAQCDVATRAWARNSLAVDYCDNVLISGLFDLVLVSHDLQEILWIYREQYFRLEEVHIDEHGYIYLCTRRKKLHILY
jgi:hypothetical protein